MPYTIRRSGNEFCVHKTDNNRRVGCHDSRKKAQAQITALNISEANKMVKKNVAYQGFPQEDVEYVTLSPFTGDEQCANCVFFNAMHVDGDGTVQPTSCKIVEPWPKPILATGHCNRYEAFPEEEEEPLLVEIQRDTQTPGLIIAPKPLQDGITDKLLRRDKAHTLFAKPADGLRLAVHITSNGYEDRDSEHVATKALQRYVDNAFKTTADSVEFVGNNPLLFWHDDNIHIGNIIYADMQSGFLMEVSRERDTPIAHKVWDFWEASANDGSYHWGTSHRFSQLKTSESDGKIVYEDIDKIETSILLMEAASNQLTTSEVIPMAKNKQEIMNEAFGIPDAASYFERGAEGLAELTALLSQNGIEAKSADDKTDVTEAVDNSIILDKMLDIFTTLSEAHADLDERIEAQVAVSKERTVSDTDMEKRIKALEDFIADTPKGASDRRISNMTSEQAAALKEAAGPQDYDTFYGTGMKVKKEQGDNHDN